MLALSSAVRSSASPSRAMFSTALLSTDFEFPGTQRGTPSSSPSSPSELTVLPSGLKIITSPNASSQTIALTYPSGSAHEKSTEKGAASLMKNGSFIGSDEKSTLRKMRDIEDTGASIFTSSTRTTTTLGLTGNPNNLSTLLPMFASVPKFTRWDGADCISLSKLEAKNASSDPSAILSDLLYNVAYQGSGLARSVMYPGDGTGCGIEGMITFRAREYSVDGSVISGAGVKDHAAFVAGVTEAFAHGTETKAKRIPSPVFTYKGGEGRVSAKSDKAFLALAFNSTGSAATNSVIQVLLGDCAFTNGNLVGVYGDVHSAHVIDLLDEMTKEVHSLLTVSNDNLSNARIRAAANVIFESEGSSQALCKSLTASALLGNTEFSTAHTMRQFESVTGDMIKKTVEDMIRGGVTFVSVGDVENVPYFEEVRKRF